MRIVARTLGQLLIAIGGVLGVAAVWQLLTGNVVNAIGLGALVVLFAAPGGLLLSYATVAARRLQAEELIRTRERFSIDEVALVLRSTQEQAHAFIAQQIAAHQLELAYRPEARGYARRSLAARRKEPLPPPPAPVAAAPCPACGSSALPTEAGFCPTCGARAEPSRSPRERA